MDTEKLSKARIIILEGVPGSGKTTLQQQLPHYLPERDITVFPEEALLFGWIHAWIPGIDEVRLSLMHRLVEHMRTEISENPNRVFVLNRFHLSYLMFSYDPDTEGYRALIEKLRGLDVHLLVLQIPHAMIAARASHSERSNLLWREHLEKRLNRSGFEDIPSMYAHEQRQVRGLLADHALSYEILGPLSGEIPLP